MQFLGLCLFGVLSTTSALYPWQNLFQYDDSYVDDVIDRVRLRITDQATVPDQLFNIAPNGSTKSFGTIKATDVLFGDFWALRRVAPVTSILRVGNVTLRTKVSCLNLSVNSTVKIELFGIETQAKANIKVTKNEFEVALTIYPDPKTGICRVALEKAAFSLLSGVIVNLEPLGFFNQIKLDATVNFITDTILPQFNNIHAGNIETALESVICNNVAY